MSRGIKCGEVVILDLYHDRSEKERFPDTYIGIVTTVHDGDGYYEACSLATGFQYAIRMSDTMSADDFIMWHRSVNKLMVNGFDFPFIERVNPIIHLARTIHTVLDTSDKDTALDETYATIKKIAELPYLHDKHNKGPMSV